MDDGLSRAALAALIADRSDDCASLSRLLGRNPAYVQQYLKRGSPKRLAERDRALLARYFGVDEAVLGGPPRVEPATVAISRFDVRASAGAGALADGDRAIGHVPFDPAWLKARGTRPDLLSVIKVTGNSMAPTLLDGDDILVDRARNRIGDGLLVLRLADALVVKRLRPGGEGQLEVLSDNPAYAPEIRPRADVDVIGTVIWVGRAL